MIARRRAAARLRSTRLGSTTCLSVGRLQLLALRAARRRRRHRWVGDGIEHVATDTRYKELLETLDETRGGRRVEALSLDRCDTCGTSGEHHRSRGTSGIGREEDTQPRQVPQQSNGGRVPRVSNEKLHHRARGPLDLALGHGEVVGRLAEEINDTHGSQGVDQRCTRCGGTGTSHNRSSTEPESGRNRAAYKDRSRSVGPQPQSQ